METEKEGEDWNSERSIEFRDFVAVAAFRHVAGQIASEM